MIPKGSTPIKNDILIDIFAKGKLSKIEMRIVSYIIRWSWGFNGINRRQDWTKELTKRQIANGIEMRESHLNENINRMIFENKLVAKDKCYQFNEHFEEWVNFPKKEVFNNNKLPEKGNKTSRKRKVNFPKKEERFTKKGSSTDFKPLQNKSLLNRKETNKETLKETLKEKSDVFIEVWNKFKDMRKKIKKPMTEYAEELIMKELDKLTNNEEEQINILKKSIMNNWQGVFKPKQLSTSKKPMTEEDILKVIGGNDE